MRIVAAASDDFDVAVLDVNLRGARSFPIADLLKNRGIPYLFPSGYSDTGIDPEHAQAVRIQEPYDESALRQAVERTLGA